MAKLSLRVTDFTDREVLRAIYELADNDGWTDLEAVAENFFPSAMRGTKARRSEAISCVAGRLNYMRWRLGVVERRVMHDKSTKTKYTMWTLTKDGETFLLGTLKSAEFKAIESAISRDGSMLEMAEVLVDHYISDLDGTAATMLRRQFQYGYGQRRSRFGRA